MRRSILLSAVAALVLAAAAVALAQGGNLGNRQRSSTTFPRIPPTSRRASADNVPRAASRLEITWTDRASRLQAAIRITSPPQVRGVATLLNALPRQGRATCAEGFISGPPTITYTFRDDAGNVLAQAHGLDGIQQPTAYCIPLFFRRNGSSMIRLEDNGAFLLRIRKLLGRMVGASS